MIDTGVILGSAVAGTIASKAIASIPNPSGVEEASVQLLRELHDTLISLHEFLLVQTKRQETADLYHIVTLYKLMSGPTITYSTHGHLYARILVGSNMIIDVSSVLGNFSISIPAATWTAFDLPDMSTLQLDSTYVNNTAQIMLRLTNVKP